MKKHRSCSPYLRYEGKVYEVNAREGMPIFTHQIKEKYRATGRDGRLRVAGGERRLIATLSISTNDFPYLNSRLDKVKVALA
ncbi:hypothetical protein [Vibrio hyugaensis]|uniref:hypothetical protein n=1 Tax=Vibrio hyugaensis TaxID=1534743 RepID=UPI003DA09638